MQSRNSKSKIDTIEQGMTQVVINVKVLFFSILLPVRKSSRMDRESLMNAATVASQAHAWMSQLAAQNKINKEIKLNIANSRHQKLLLLIAVS